MWNFLLGLLPPVPALAVGRAMREGTERFDVLPVGESDKHVRGLGVRPKEGRRSAEDCMRVEVRQDPIPS